MPFRLAIAALAAVALALPAASPASAQEKLTVLLDWFVNPDHGPLIVAAEQGLFAAEGLEVELVAPSDPSLPPKLVAAGKADIAVSYQPQLHLQVEAGLPLVRVGTLVATPLNCLLVRADGPIRSIADLKGATVGYSVAGVEESLMTAMLGRAGLSLDDVTMINVNFALSQAVLAGQVDAVIGAFRNFELTQMRLKGVEGRCFFVEEEGVPTYDELIYVANRAALEDPEKRDALRRFLRATERATQAMVNDPEATWEIFKGTDAKLDDALNRQAWLDTLPRFALRPSAVDVTRYRDFSAFLADAGLISGAQDPNVLAVDLGAEALE